MPDKKGPDEVYCASCGEAIKARAKVCPNCGVKNERYEDPQQTQSTQRESNNRVTSDRTASSEPVSQPDPSKIQPTDVWGKWHFGVGAGVVFMLIGFALSPDAVGGFATLSALVLIPLSTYFDAQWVAAKTHWQPNQNLWAVLGIFPLINIVSGGAYLLRRYDAERSSESNYVSPDRESDNALEQLRERYSRGEISDEEFEERVERLVGTESDKTAEDYVKSNNKGNN